MNLLPLEEVKVETAQCKGLFWRGSISSFISSYKSIEVRKSLRLLKKLSCPGCENCDWIWEELGNEYISFEDSLEIKHGKLYTFKIHSSQGYYDSYPEIDGIEFIEIKETRDEKRL